MDRYQKVEKPKPDSPINENEIRITSQGLIRNYVSYATSLLQEKRVKEIVMKAMGQAISKTVAITEILKKNLPRLHQDVAISSVSITDVWEPMEEGLMPVELTRHVSMISITLSMRELNKDSPGYQAPSLAQQSKPQNQTQQPRQSRAPYNTYNEDSYGRGRGRGGGRGGGRGRGGYGNYQGNYQRGYQGNYRGGYQGNYQMGYQGKYQDGYQGDYQENYQDNSGGYSNWSRGRGRGRGWGYRVDIKAEEVASTMVEVEGVGTAVEEVMVVDVEGWVGAGVGSGTVVTRPKLSLLSLAFG
ncbi:PREDICTED: keratin, type I cytoskeletal 9 isoform X2 [Tarenaya hassleriana]|nr:PREDICTED: keratin, type I cytoskeletal 9 isoform X2 [Tarenaya hassleriana]